MRVFCDGVGDWSLAIAWSDPPADEAKVGVEEDESPRKDLLRLGGGGAGAFDGLLDGLEDICNGSAVMSSVRAIDRPEFRLLIDIGLLLLEGGGAGAGFFCGNGLVWNSLGSIGSSV